MLQTNPIKERSYFERKDGKFQLRILENIILLVGYYAISADMFPILGLLSTTFLLLPITFFGFYTYKRRRLKASFNPLSLRLFIIMFLLSFFFFFLFFTSKVDYLIILARPFNFLISVEPILPSEKIGYLTAYLIMQVIPLLIFVAILTPRQKVVWKLDALDQTLHLTFCHPLYSEKRTISLMNIIKVEFGAEAPLVRVFTNTLKINMTKTDFSNETHEIAPANTPILVLQDSLISLFQTCANDRKVTLKWFRETGDYLQSSVFTRNQITDEVTLPLNLSQRFSQSRDSLIDPEIRMEDKEKRELIHRGHGAVYRRRLADSLVLFIGILFLVASLLLGSILPTLTVSSLMLKEFDLPHAFNGEILLFLSLFLIILFFSVRLIYVSCQRIFGRTTLYWTNNGLFIGTKWYNFRNFEYFVPYTLVWDFYSTLESITSGLSILWLQTPFLTIPIWSFFSQEKISNNFEVKQIVNSTLSKVEQWTSLQETIGK
ncbi:MAG: hypothetical protein ACTSW1_02205 [Candidatus Hodarchaeales archaeon]